MVFGGDGDDPLPQGPPIATGWRRGDQSQKGEKGERNGAIVKEKSKVSGWG